MQPFIFECCHCCLLDYETLVTRSGGKIIAVIPGIQPYSCLANWIVVYYASNPVEMEVHT